jgi:DNA-binding transcriptional LysR family regulator
LVPLLEQFQVENRALYAIYPSRATMPRKVRTFVGFLQERYRKPAWDQY